MTTEPFTKEQLRQRVISYAKDHYDQGGWDYVVETMSDAEIIEIIGNAKTVLGALRKVSKEIGPRAAYRADVIGYGR